MKQMMTRGPSEDRTYFAATSFPKRIIGAGPRLTLRRSTEASENTAGPASVSHLVTANIIEVLGPLLRPFKHPFLQNSFPHGSAQVN